MNIKILFLGLMLGCQEEDTENLEPSVLSWACGPSIQENSGLSVMTTEDVSTAIVETEEKNYTVYLGEFVYLEELDLDLVNGSISLPYFDCDNIINIRLAR